MTEADDLPIAVRQLGHGLHQLPVEDPLVGQRAWVDSRGWLTGQGPFGLLPTTGPTMMVKGGVARDLEQPRGRAGMSRLEARVGFERLHEDLGGHVLSVRCAPQL